MAIDIFRNNYPSAVDNHFICSLLDKDFCVVQKKKKKKNTSRSNVNFLIGVLNKEYTCPVGRLGEAKVSCNWYWLTVRQGLLSLQQVKVEGECFISSVSSLSFVFLSPCPSLSSPLFSGCVVCLNFLSLQFFCLQETFLKPDDQLNIRDFNTYNYIYSEGQRPSGGSSILVHSSCPQREIKLVTNLQAVAVSVTLDKEITISSVYLPPNFHLETEHLDTLLKQLPSLYILSGDFNGHNILWGCKDNNPICTIAFSGARPV